MNAWKLLVSILRSAKAVRAGLPQSPGCIERSREAAVTRWFETSGIHRYLVVLLLLAGRASEAQTTCATQHTDSGAFICYPNPSENGGDSLVPAIFHLSAQGNAADGRKIAGYKVLIDNRVIYEKKLMVPIQKLSIETNFKSPFDSGSHTLQVVIPGIGSAEVNKLQFYPSANASFCEPFSRTDPRMCSPSPVGGSFQWSLPEAPPGASTPDVFDRYSAYIKLYGLNLKKVEADVAEAMAVDAQGNLYIASHAFADVDLRKYGPNGSLLYASLIRSCGDGFLSVAGLAIDSTGRAWIAGNTTACLSTTPNAILSHLSHVGQARGFVMLVDTTKSTSMAPLYVTYLADVDNRIAAIRVDSEGNAYITGTTESLEFPHDSSLKIREGSAQLGPRRSGFVAALNPTGSGLLWSTILPDAQLTALALDDAGNVYVTGRVSSQKSSSGAGSAAQPGKKTCGAEGKLTMECGDVLVAELSDRGRRLSYAASFGGRAEEQGQTISATGQGAWIFVTGDTDSPDFPTSSAENDRHQEGLQSFAVALQPCRSGAQYSRLLTEVSSNTAPAMALTPALDAFTSAFSGGIAGYQRGITGRKPFVPVQLAPECPSTKP